MTEADKQRKNYGIRESMDEGKMREKLDREDQIFDGGKNDIYTHGGDGRLVYSLPHSEKAPGV